MDYLEEIKSKNQQKINEIMTEFSKGYNTKSWKSQYLPRLNKFFSFIESTYPSLSFEKIDSQEINSFLDSLTSESERVNCYWSLTMFYKFTYASNITNEVLRGVVKPPVPQRKVVYIPNEHIELIKEFIENDSNKLIDRLLLAFCLYTGLKRRYIFNIRNWHIWPLDGSENSCLWIIENDKHFQFPLCPALLNIILLYAKKREKLNPNDRVFNYYGDSYISDRIAVLSKKITGVKYTPEIFSNTFIKHALVIDNDIYTVSSLTLLSVNAISKHVQITNDLSIKQKDIMANIFKAKNSDK